jgi:hypothetical protein
MLMMMFWGEREAEAAGGIFDRLAFELLFLFDGA